MNTVTHAYAGAFPLVTIETQSSALHRPWGKAADLFPILERYPYSRNAPPEKVAHTLALSADPRDRLVVNS